MGTVWEAMVLTDIPLQVEKLSFHRQILALASAADLLAHKSPESHRL
jgi:hypothetical protein